MPDVGRSDSQRSDTSQRPRVSFNRDVHVKRIGPGAEGVASAPGGGGARLVGALAGDGAGRLVPLAVRREKPSRLSRRQLAEEARRVLRQADRVQCRSSADLALSEGRRFATLPPLRPGRGKGPFGEAKSREAKPKTPGPAAEESGFKRAKTTLVRSLSDAANAVKKAPRKAALGPTDTSSLHRPKKLRGKLFYSEGSPSPSPSPAPRRRILKKSLSDSESQREPTAGAAALDAAGARQRRKKKQLSPIIESAPREDYFTQQGELEPTPEEGSKEAGEEEEEEEDAQAMAATALRGQRLPSGAHGGRRPGAVETLVRRLSAESASRPPRRPPRGLSPSALVAPGDDRRHNNNLPFSYTEPAVPPPSPPPLPPPPPADGAGSPTGPGQVIYAEVVVGSGGRRKQTVHTAVPSLVAAHSDEDEGLGMDAAAGRRDVLLHRGRADGMDARRKDLEETSRYESYIRYSDTSLEKAPRGASPSRGDLSARRDRLESRLERRLRHETEAPAPAAPYTNRRQFLDSQLDYESGSSSRVFCSVDSEAKKDLFADSGIEVDYRKHDDSSFKTEGMTAKIVINGSAQTLNGRGGETFSSTRLVQESRRVAEPAPAPAPAPASSVLLVRHYAPQRSGSPSASERFVQAERTQRARERRGHVTDDEDGERRGSPDSKAAADKKKKRGVSAMERVKLLFTRSGDSKTLKKNKKEKNGKKGIPEETDGGEEDDPVRARYTEYKGSAVESDTETLTYSRRGSPSRGSPVRGSPTRHYDEQTLRNYDDGTLTRASPTRHYDESTLRRASPTRHYDEGTLRRASPTRHYDEGTSRRASPTRHYDDGTLRRASPTRRYDEQMLSPYARASSPGDRGRRQEHRSPTPTTPDPHLLQVPRDGHSPVRVRSSQYISTASSRTTTRADGAELEFIQSRERLATPDHTPRASPRPSPAPVRAAQSSATLTRISNRKNKEEPGGGAGGWFKSLDRLAKRGKTRTKAQAQEEEEGAKTLRYFGDTDQEDKDSVASIPPPMPLQTHHRYKSSSHLGRANGSATQRTQVPWSSGGGGRPGGRRRGAGDAVTSSADSATEGDSHGDGDGSQQSQRSVVYLHAATVGDIPTQRGTAKRNVGRRAQSREELTSMASTHLQPHKRTISRSISVLAPWRPRHYREGQEVHYDQEDNNKNYIKNGKPPKVPLSQQSTMSRINRKKNAENRASAPAQRQHAGKAPSENSHGHGHGTPHPAASVESLRVKAHAQTQSRDKKGPATDLNSNSHKKIAGGGGNTKKASSKVTRSASMPKDTRVKAGWFKLRNKKQAA